ncbi:hypothetical protein MFUL124B02_11410 [Myxococcus fulvus 124B02]|nr:hypothetical protein MFUL124B02_11410 [Myxococcus fulvus 124B02]
MSRTMCQTCTVLWAESQAGWLRRISVSPLPAQADTPWAVIFTALGSPPVVVAGSATWHQSVSGRSASGETRVAHKRLFVVSSQKM